MISGKVCTHNHELRKDGLFTENIINTIVVVARTVTVVVTQRQTLY